LCGKILSTFEPNKAERLYTLLQMERPQREEREKNVPFCPSDA